MKKILSFLGTITLIGASTTSLVACDNIAKYTYEELAKLKEENKINTTNQEIRYYLEWITPQEKPFNEVDNKWYYVVWRGDKNDNWRIIKFKSNNFKTIDKFNNFELQILPPKNKIICGLLIGEKKDWGYKPIKIWIDDKNNSHFKSVHRWNGEEQKLPSLDIDKDGNVKVKNE